MPCHGLAAGRSDPDTPYFYKTKVTKCLHFLWVTEGQKTLEFRLCKDREKLLMSLIREDVIEAVDVSKWDLFVFSDVRGNYATF